MAAFQKSVPVEDFDKILTIAEVAAELRCSKAHVYNAINGMVAGGTEVRRRFGAPTRGA